MSTELAVQESASIATWTPSFAVGIDEAVAAVDAKRDFFRRVMREDEHFGKIPGTGDKAKPTLLKPGAELLLANMGLRPELTDADTPTIDYGEEGHEGLIRYRRVCQIYRQTGPGVNDKMLVAQAEGSCSSRETKYRWRKSERSCPACGKNAIIAENPQYAKPGDTPGYMCWKKKDGCGKKFGLNDPAITAQTIGKIANPDLADVENTILKMADKRALVAATLLATGCSDMFTQDVDDNERDADGRRDAQRDDGVIEGEFTATPPSEDKVSPPVSAAIVAKLQGLMAQLNFDRARIEKAILWTTAQRTKLVTELAPGEAAQLEAYLDREIAKAPKLMACTACGATPGAAGTIEDHEFDAKGVPCPNDMSAAAEEARAFFAKQIEMPL